jgi:hypothetical protein
MFAENQDYYVRLVMYVCRELRLAELRTGIIVLMFTDLLVIFLNDQTRWVPDTCPKLDGYGYRYEFLPIDTGMCMNLHPYF